MTHTQSASTSRVWNAKSYAKAPRRTYPKPKGSRLQLSGQWLSDAGFLPGGAYTIRSMSAGIRVETSATGATITASHEAAKLYVPADLLKAETIEVLQVAPGKLLVRGKH